MARLAILLSHFRPHFNATHHALLIQSVNTAFRGDLDLRHVVVKVAGGKGFFGALVKIEMRIVK